MAQSCCFCFFSAHFVLLIFQYLHYYLYWHRRPALLELMLPLAACHGIPLSYFSCFFLSIHVCLLADKLSLARWSVRPPHVSTFGPRAFCSSSPLSWNALPSQLRDQPSQSTSSDNPWKLIFTTTIFRLTAFHSTPTCILLSWVSSLNALSWQFLFSYSVFQKCLFTYLLTYLLTSTVCGCVTVSGSARGSVCHTVVRIISS